MKINSAFFIIFLAFQNLWAREIKGPIIIGHRGASGHRPEHTLASYQLAIDMGADYIEPDLVMTKDKVLMARHENEISLTSDVATKFPDRKTTKKVDGKDITGWFIEDFTYDEIKTLKARERLPNRDHSYDGKFEIASFLEILELVKKQKRPVGIYPETKHPSYFKSIGLPLEEAMILELKKFGLNKKGQKVFIQSFELENLKELKKITPLPLIYLLDDPEMIPFDHVLKNDKRTYADMLKDENLKEIKKVAYGIGPYKRYIVPVNDKNEIQNPTDLIKRAHKIGLKVHAYTFRSDPQYLHPIYQGDPKKEYLQFFQLKIDGVFSDFSDVAVKAREEFLKN